MADKVVSISKNDVVQIIEVNKKAIELQSEVSLQNEEVLESLEKSENYLKSIEKKIDKNEDNLNKILESLEEVESMTKDLKDSIYKMNVLLGSGVLALIINIIQFVISLKK